MRTKILRTRHKHVCTSRTPAASSSDTLPHCDPDVFRWPKAWTINSARSCSCCWLMFCAFKLLHKIKPRTLVNTHTPTGFHLQKNCDHATLLSPHNCTMSPPSRVCTIMSRKPRSLGVSFSNVYSPSFFSVLLCSMQKLHFIQDAINELVHVFWRVLLLCSQSSSLSHPSNMQSSCTTHSLDCANPTFASILCCFQDLRSSFLCVGHYHHLVVFHLNIFCKESRIASRFFLRRRMEAVMKMQRNADQRKLSKGDSPQKVEAAKRGGWKSNEERSKSIEVRFAQWVCLENNEKCER